VSMPAVVTGGFGTFAGVEFLPTFGYTPGSGITDTPGCVCLSVEKVGDVTISIQIVDDVTLSVERVGDVTVSVERCSC